MVAGSFVAQRPFDDDEIRRFAGGDDLPSRRQADQQATAARKQLLGDQNGEGCSNDPSNDANLPSGKGEYIELGVVTWPAREALCAPGPPKVAHDISVRIEKANGGHVDRVDVLLPSCFPHQCRRQENGPIRRILVAEDRGSSHLCTSSE
jgi:hypothetical protein